MPAETDNRKVFDKTTTRSALEILDASVKDLTLKAIANCELSGVTKLSLKTLRDILLVKNTGDVPYFRLKPT